MAQMKTLGPSRFDQVVYVSRGILALCRHFLKYRLSYCARKAETPLSHRRQYYPHQSVSEISPKYQNLADEPYLRPTKECNSLAPEIESLASHLRNRGNSDWDFACAIHDFVCNEIAWMAVMPPPKGVVDTLRRGYGSCRDKVSLLVALSRAGGIPARYCVVDSRFVALGPQEMVGQKINIYDWVIGYALAFNSQIDFNLKTIARRDLSAFMHLGLNLREYFGRYEHPHCELKIGDVWIPADPSFDNCIAAGLDFPLQRLGYDPQMLWGLTCNVTARTEEIPKEPHERMLRRLFCAFTCGEGSCLNLATDQARARGRQVLAELGESEYIRTKRDYYVPVPGVTKLSVRLAQ
jgi:hypothetical protein